MCTDVAGVALTLPSALYKETSGIEGAPSLRGDIGRDKSMRKCARSIT